jgi:hypothetical protein
MRSMLQIINLVVDGEITTSEQADALVETEAAEAAEFYNQPIEEARTKLLHNIGYVTGYLSHKAADHVMELFNTEHPVFGTATPNSGGSLPHGSGIREPQKEND